MKSFLLLALATAAVACVSPRRLEMKTLASAQVSNDFESYEIRRVGLLPLAGSDASSDALRHVRPLDRLAARRADELYVVAEAL